MPTADTDRVEADLRRVRDSLAGCPWPFLRDALLLSREEAEYLLELVRRDREGT